MCSLELSNAVLPTGFCANTLPVEMDQVRSILSTGTRSLLALERGTSSVVLLEDTDGDGLANVKTRILSTPGLNHGLAVHDGYLYASTDSAVYRWSFNTGDGEASIGVTVVGERELVIQNIDADGMGGAIPGAHSTRTLAFGEDDDNVGRLYVSVGSASNVDTDSFRSRIRRFSLQNNNTNTSMIFPMDFVEDGQVFADGLRDEVGLAFDRYGVLWGVESSAEDLVRSDLGGDIHNDNPVRSSTFRYKNSFHIDTSRSKDAVSTVWANSNWLFLSMFLGRRTQPLPPRGYWKTLGVSLLLDRI
jgi:glucose/arabinose dehydrogenase